MEKCVCGAILMRNMCYNVVIGNECPKSKTKEHAPLYNIIVQEQTNTKTDTSIPIVKKFTTRVGATGEITIREKEISLEKITDVSYGRSSNLGLSEFSEQASEFPWTKISTQLEKSVVSISKYILIEDDSDLNCVKWFLAMGATVHLTDCPNHHLAKKEFGENSNVVFS